MRDRLMLEYSEKMCEYCCNFDKKHIGMDGIALCKLTMTLAYAEDYGGNCMFYNVPKEQIIVPPCKVGDTVYWIGQFNQVVEGKATMIGTSIGAKIPYLDYEFDFTSADIGKTVFLTREEAEQALKGGEG